MKLLLSDNSLHLRFAPLTLTKPLAELRCGIYTNTERWKLLLPQAEIGFQTEGYLQQKYQSIEGIWINAQCIATEGLAQAVLNLQMNQALYYKGHCLAINGLAQSKVELGSEPILLENRWDLYLKNEQILKADFQLASLYNSTATLKENNLLIGPSTDLLLMEGVQAEGVTFNTKAGPIYVGKNVEIMEGSLLRGPLAILDGAVIKMGAKIYGATTVGPHCRIGGEVSNSLFQGYSNKGHDGFLGNALIGEWCNLGADTNCSNLKNNYSTVSTYCYEHGSMQSTNELFMGLTMGDHSMSAINVQFNTATVVGVGSNVMTSGFPPKYIPSFQWISDSLSEEHNFEKALGSISAMMSRRNTKLRDQDIEILRFLAKN